MAPLLRERTGSASTDCALCSPKLLSTTLPARPFFTNYLRPSERQAPSGGNGSRRGPLATSLQRPAGGATEHRSNASSHRQQTCKTELERVFDGDEGGGDDAHGEYIDGVVADALGDGEMGVSSGAHGGAGF